MIFFLTSLIFYGFQRINEGEPFVAIVTFFVAVEAFAVMASVATAGGFFTRSAVFLFCLGFWIFY